LHISRASHPDEIALLFVEFANSGDLDALVGLYEPDAVLATGPGQVARGHDEIRRVYRSFLALKPVLVRGRQQPALVGNGVALTSTQLIDGTVTVEIAREQKDGAWLWSVDQASLLKFWATPESAQR
jgi:hypothetical protein